MTTNAAINGAAKTIIIDTGSEQNIISKDLATSIDTRQTAHLLAVGNTRVETLGKTVVKLRLANLTIPCTAIVVDKLPLPLILGMRSLTDLEAVIDLKKFELRLFSDGKEHTVALNSKGTETPKAKFVNLTQILGEDTDYKNMYHHECLANVKNTLSRPSFNSMSCENTELISVDPRKGGSPKNHDIQGKKGGNEVIKSLKDRYSLV